MSVTGYLGKNDPQLGMVKGKDSGVGAVFHGPVLGGEKTVEEERKLDAVKASRAGGNGNRLITKDGDLSRQNESYKNVADYDPVLLGSCRLL